MLTEADQDNILYGYFPANRRLCGLDQNRTSNFFVQCCLRHIWITLSIQYSYAMLSQLDRNNIV